MNNLAIIPARGGSKRIPRKNIKSFLGKPIISYSIIAAIDSGLFSEVMVSTDDEEIATIAIDLGAKVPFFRSKINSNDYASTFDVIKEVYDNYEKRGFVFDNICCIYPCAPFVNISILNNAYQILLKNNYDSVLPVIKYGFPIQRSLRIDDLNKIHFNFPEHFLTRSQDLTSNYHDAGQFYWLNANKCISENKIITTNTGSIEISELEGQDIDNEIDWKIAELKYEILQGIK